MTTAGIAAGVPDHPQLGKDGAGFMQALGYEPDFTTDHNSGLFRNGDGPCHLRRGGPARESRRPSWCCGCPIPRAVRFDGGRQRDRHRVRGDPLRDKGNDHPRSRRQAVDTAGRGPASRDDHA